MMISVMIKKKNSAILLLMFLLSACSGPDTELPPGYRIFSIPIFLESDVNNKIKERLEERDIPFEVSEQGHIHYSAINQAEVLGIIRDIRFNGEIRSDYFEMMVVSSKISRDLFAAAFDEEGILYRVEASDISEGYFVFYWNQTYGAKVDVIRQRVNMTLE
jgi:hypothetical protein